jgi:glycosyltransferase involved in cell wall biosynthesis
MSRRHAAGYLVPLVSAIADVLRDQAYTWAVLLVDDGSDDATRAEVLSLGERFPVRLLVCEPVGATIDPICISIEHVTQRRFLNN